MHSSWKSIEGSWLFGQIFLRGVIRFVRKPMGMSPFCVLLYFYDQHFLNLTNLANTNIKIQPIMVNYIRSYMFMLSN